ELTRRALERIAAQAPTGTTVVVNPSPAARTEVVDDIGLVSVPPLGWTAVGVQTLIEIPPVEVDGTTLQSDLVSFDVESIRIVDGGDFGDSYNYAPPVEDRIVDRPVEERVEVLESGSLRARLLLERTYEWPRAVEADGSRRSDETVSVPLQLHAELRV